MGATGEPPRIWPGVPIGVGYHSGSHFATVQAMEGKYLAALRRAQMEIDLRPELFKHYHLRSVPEKYRDRVRRAGVRDRRAHRLPPVHQREFRRDPAVD